MSEALENRAEIAKLARLLSRRPEQIEYLTELPSQDIRELREQVTEVLFSAGAGSLGRLAAASKLLPVGLVATMAERAFGPVLSARVAALLEPDRAVQMAARLPTPFVTDIAIELDPRRAHEVISQIPPAQIAAVTRELVRRQEFVTMGRFVGHLDPDAVAAAVEAMDDSSLLQIAFVLETKDSFRDLLELLSPERLEHVIDTAAVEDLWPEALDLLTNLSDEQRRRVIELAASRDDAVLDALIVSAQAEQIWELVLPLTSLMSQAGLRRFAALRSLQAPGVLEEIVDVAVDHADLWQHLVPLVALLPERCQARVARHVSELERDGVLIDGIDSLLRDGDGLPQTAG
jgi:hypothetical protein